MNHHTMRRARLLLLAVVTLVVAFAGSAAATRAIAQEPETDTDGLQYVTRTVIVAPATEQTATVPCPDGRVAVDGGVASEPLTRVVASAPAGDGSGWGVQLLNQHPAQALTAHAWAGCLAVG